MLTFLSTFDTYAPNASKQVFSTLPEVELQSWVQCLGFRVSGKPEIFHVACFQCNALPVMGVEELCLYVGLEAARRLVLG